MLRREKGFTLIELLIVVAIIGIIAAIAVPNLLTAIQRSKRSRTTADMRAIGTALGSYQVDTNQFPILSAGSFSTVAGNDNYLPSSYYEGATKDGWTNSFFYSSDGQGGYTLKSWGKDGGSAENGEFNSNIVYINGQFAAPSTVVKK
jgi:type II secretion system protein G